MQERERSEAVQLRAKEREWRKNAMKKRKSGVDHGELSFRCVKRRE